jgi:hypothetical protein
MNGQHKVWAQTIADGIVGIDNVDDVEIGASWFRIHLACGNGFCVTFGMLQRLAEVCGTNVINLQGENVGSTYPEVASYIEILNVRWP